MEPTDEQLAQASIKGDSEAFGTLVEPLHGPLIAYLTGLLGRPDEAEELAQETFLIAWKKLRSLRDPARVGGWIYRIAHNLARAQAKLVRMAPLADDPPAHGNASQEDQRLVELLMAVARLSQPHREVISRKHFAGCSSEEIARQLDIPPGTVRSRLSRAYAQLRTMLTEQESD